MPLSDNSCHFTAIGARGFECYSFQNDMLWVWIIILKRKKWELDIQKFFIIIITAINHLNKIWLLYYNTLQKYKVYVRFPKQIFENTPYFGNKRKQKLSLSLFWGRSKIFIKILRKKDFLAIKVQMLIRYRYKVPSWILLKINSSQGK